MSVETRFTEISYEDCEEKGYSSGVHINGVGCLYAQDTPRWKKHRVLVCRQKRCREANRKKTPRGTNPNLVHPSREKGHNSLSQHRKKILVTHVHHSLSFRARACS